MELVSSSLPGPVPQDSPWRVEGEARFGLYQAAEHRGKQSQGPIRTESAGAKLEEVPPVRGAEPAGQPLGSVASKDKGHLRCVY